MFLLWGFISSDFSALYRSSYSTVESGERGSFGLSRPRERASKEIAMNTKGLGVALATVLIGGGALALGGFALATASPHQTALQCVKSTTQAHTCSITLATYPDSEEGVHGNGGGPHPDWVTYSNDNIDVPANTTVDVTIDQYDSGGAANNPYFDNVIGTRGGFDTVNGKKTTKVDA